MLPIPALAEAAAGLGHVNIAFDRDGEPRYDYLALPFSGDFIPSLPVRVAAAYLGRAVERGRPRARRRRPTRRSIDPDRPGDARSSSTTAARAARSRPIRLPIWSRAVWPPDLLKGRIVLIGASFIGIADSYPAPFGSTPIPGTERIANIVDTILPAISSAKARRPGPRSDRIGRGAWRSLAGIAAALLPTRLAALGGAVPILGWAGGAQIAFEHGLWLPLVNPVVALAVATAGVLLFRYGFVDQQRRRIQSAFRHYLAPDLVNALAAHPERLQLGGETRMLA